MGLGAKTSQQAHGSQNPRERLRRRLGFAGKRVLAEFLEALAKEERRTR